MPFVEFFSTVNLNLQWDTYVQIAKRRHGIGRIRYLGGSKQEVTWFVKYTAAGMVNKAARSNNATVLTSTVKR